MPASAGDIRDMSLIPGSERFPGGGHGDLLQHSCLENPVDRVAQRATVYRVTKSQTQLKRLNTHTHTFAFVDMNILGGILNLMRSVKQGIHG